LIARVSLCPKSKKEILPKLGVSIHQLGIEPEKYPALAHGNPQHLNIEKKMNQIPQGYRINKPTSLLEMLDKPASRKDAIHMQEKTDTRKMRDHELDFEREH